MLVVIDGKTLKEVCEIELSRLKVRQNVELVVRHDAQLVVTNERVYSKDKLEKGKL